MSEVSIVDIGKALEKYGLRVGENPAFGTGRVGKHAPKSHHYFGEAIDVTDWRQDVGPEYEGGKPLSWQERTKRLAQRAKQSGLFTEALGPGDPGHETHTHLALRGKKKISPELLEWVATGRYKSPEGAYATSMPGLQPAAAPQTAPAMPSQQALISSAMQQQQQEADKFLLDYIGGIVKPKREPLVTPSIDALAMLKAASQTPEFFT